MESLDGISTVVQLEPISILWRINFSLPITDLLRSLWNNRYTAEKTVTSG